MNGSFSAKIGARITEFMAKMKQVQSTIKKSANDVRVDIGADVAQFKRKTAEVKAKMLALSREKVVVKIEARIEDFQRKIQRIAVNIRAFGELMQHTVMGTMMTVFPALSPILANLAVAIANLGPMIGIVAGSTFALAGGFVSAGAAATAFGAVAIPTIKKLFDEEAKLNAVQQKAKNSFDAVKATYQSLVKETEKPVLQAFTSGMKATDTILNKLRPLFVSSSQAVANLMNQLNTAIGTPPIQKFLEYLNTSGAPMLETFSRSFGNVFKGLLSMLTAFAPLSASTAKGFEEMTARFAEWANGLSSSAKFQAFMDYVNTNMPKIRAIFRDATAGVIYFFSAFAGSSSDMMDGLVSMMARFKEWSSTLSQNQGFQQFLSYVHQTAPSVLQLIGNLTQFLVNLGIGMAPLGAKIIEIANKVLEFVNSAMEGNRAIGVLIAGFISFGGALLAIVPNLIAFSTLFSGLGTAISTTLGAAFNFIQPLFTNFTATITRLATATLPQFGAALGFITSLVGLVIAAITGLIAIFVGLYQTNETFRTQVQTIWSSIVSVVSSAINAVKSLVISVASQISTFWRENQEEIQKITSKIWKFIGDFVTKTLNLLLSIFKLVYPILKSIVVSTWTAIQNVIQGATKIILGIIKTFTSLFTGNWSGLWSGIKQILSGAVQALWGIINLWFVGKFLGPLKGFASGAKSIISTLWSAIKTIFSNALMAIKTLITQGFSAYVQAISLNMQLAKQAIVSGWNAAKSFLSNIKLVEIGKNIIRGLINGIGSMMGAVGDKVAEIANSIPAGIKKLLGIHSPSRVMIAIAKWIPVGVAKGIEASTNVVQKATNMMVRSAIPDFTQNLSITKDMIQQTQRIVSNAAKDNSKEILAIQKDYAAKRAEATKKADAQIKEIKAKAADKHKKLTAAQERQITKILEDAKVSREKLAKAEAQAIGKIKVKSQKETFDALKDFADKQIGLEKWSTKQQAEYWRYAATAFKEGTDERIEAQINYNKAMAELTKEKFDKEKDYIDRKKKYNQMSLTQELAAYQKYLQQYKVGSEERIYYEDKIAETKQAIHEKLTSLNDEYISKIKETQQKEIDGIKELEKAYEDAVASRTKDIYSWKNLFDEIGEKAEITSQQLIKNLQDQVSVMATWSRNMQELAGKGIDKGLLAELQAMGPSAYAEIEALNSMTATELNYYNDIWKTKTALARSQAQAELVDLREGTNKQIDALKNDTKKQLESYKDEWLKQIKAIKTGTVGEFNAMKASMYQIGTDVINGLRNGMKSEVPKMLSEVKAMSSEIEKTIRKTLDIHSPSRVADKLGAFFGQGFTNGIASMRADAAQAAASLADAAQADLSVLTDGLSVRSAISSAQDITSESVLDLSMFDKVLQLLKIIADKDPSLELDGRILTNYVDERSASKVSLKRQMRG